MICTQCGGKTIRIPISTMLRGTNGVPVNIPTYNWWRCVDCHVEIGRPKKKYDAPVSEYDMEKEKIKSLPRIKDKGGKNEPV